MAKPLSNNLARACLGSVAPRKDWLTFAVGLWLKVTVTSGVRTDREGESRYASTDRQLQSTKTIVGHCRIRHDHNKNVPDCDRNKSNVYKISQ